MNMSISDKIKGIFKSTLASSKEKLGHTKENLDKAIARVAGITGQDDKAREIYSKILNENPDDVNASINLGVIKYKEKDFSSAAGLFSNALKNSDEFDPYSDFTDLDRIYYSALMIRTAEPSKALQAVDGKDFNKEHTLDFLIINALAYNMLGHIETEIGLLFKIHEYLQKKSWNSSVFEPKDLLNSSFRDFELSDNKPDIIKPDNIKLEDVSKGVCSKIINLLSISRDQKLKIDNITKLYAVDKTLKNRVIEFLNTNFFQKESNDQKEYILQARKFILSIWEEDNDYKKIRDSLVKILQLVEGAHRLAYLKKLAKCCVKLKDKELYQKCLARILEIDPGDSQRAANYCEILIKDGNKKAALKILEKGGYKDNKRCMDMLGRLYFDQKDYSRALIIFQELKDINQDNLNYIKLCADCFFELKEFDQAVMFYEKIGLSQNFDVDIALKLSYLYLQKKAGANFYELLKQGHSKKWFYTIENGKTLIEPECMKIVRAAIELIKQEDHSKPNKQVYNKGRLCFILGAVFEEVQDYNRALEFYSAARKFDHEDSETALACIRCLYKLGKIYEAVSIYKVLLINFENNKYPSWSYDNFKPFFNIYETLFSEKIDFEKMIFLPGFSDLSAEEQRDLINYVPHFCDLALKTGKQELSFSLAGLFLSYLKENGKKFDEADIFFTPNTDESDSVDYLKMIDVLKSVIALILFRKNDIEQAKEYIEGTDILPEYRFKMLKAALIKGNHGYVLASPLNRGLYEKLDENLQVEYEYIMGICHETAMNTEKAMEFYNSVKSRKREYRDVEMRISRLEIREDK
jgi:tetratricopeptide (TPR) repeat protein